MSKAEKIAAFDPDGAGQTGAGIFGLPFTEAEADIVILPVPWEVTVSFRTGTAQGPAAILAASPQLDLYDEAYGATWQRGIYMCDIPAELQRLGAGLRPQAAAIVAALESGQTPDPAQLATVNAGCADMNAWVETQAAALLTAGKRVILLGGDHSTPLGYYRALAQKHDEFGILQLDAHMDLRAAYEGFTYSHASVMYNALQLPEVVRIVQVGLRDLSEGELRYADSLDRRVVCFTDRQMRHTGYRGEKTWQDLCQQIVAALPKYVHVSFDIDALQAWLCPNTGTPVPGGLDFEQALFLLHEVRQSGRTIIGADLVEVAPGDGEVGSGWDENVGARILYRLCGLLA